MTKSKLSYICQECGSVQKKWMGQCPDCGAWNSMQEEVESANNFYSTQKTKTNSTANIEFINFAQDVEEYKRVDSGYNELNQVLGGGFVPGGVVLIGGDPGIGKSTLLLQVSALMAVDLNSVYISGEESASQIIMRARRLGVKTAQLKLLTATNLTIILEKIKKSKVDLLVIDSIQTIFMDNIPSAPGSVSQVRACGYELIRLAKDHNITLILVGHVTKEGQIAGPKVLEHMVDTVLYFEGENSNQYRIIRSVKNRFGNVNEIGVFEMQGSGLKEVNNPSSLFINQYEKEICGSSIYAGIEGTRPIFAEIQALVAPTFMASPRRYVVGWDNNRLSMLIAVLATKCNINLTDKEVYLNVIGGLKISEPALDLAAVAALISAVTNQPILGNALFIGEVGLSGEIRAVNHIETRIKEAIKLGFKHIICPKFELSKNMGELTKNNEIEINMIKHVNQLQKVIF